MNLKEFFKNEKPHYRRLFIELCKRVGAKLEDVELIKEDNKWALPHEAYTWTMEEEDSYKDWLVEYVYKYRRKFRIGYASKKWIRDREASMFILNYSWKYSDAPTKEDSIGNGRYYLHAGYEDYIAEKE